MVYCVSIKMHFSKIQMLNPFSGMAVGSRDDMLALKNSNRLTCVDSAVTSHAHVPEFARFLYGQMSQHASHRDVIIYKTKVKQNRKTECFMKRKPDVGYTKVKLASALTSISAGKSCTSGSVIPHWHQIYLDKTQWFFHDS